MTDRFACHAQCQAILFVVGFNREDLVSCNWTRYLRLSLVSGVASIWSCLSWVCHRCSFNRPSSADQSIKCNLVILSITEISLQCKRGSICRECLVLYYIIVFESCIHGSVHRNSVLIRSNKMQQYAGIYLLQNHSFLVSIVPIIRST